MAGLRPGHPRLCCSQDVDARHEAGHDEHGYLERQLQICIRIPAARCARGFAKPFAQENRGRRECRVPAAPAASRAKSSEAHELKSPQVHRSRPGIPRAMVLTAYSVLSPASNSSCHRRWRIKGSSNPVELDFASASLTPATGARTTRLHRPLKRRSSCTPLIAHEVHLALRLPLRAWRPCVHRIPPRVRDDRDPPLLSERDGEGFKSDLGQAGTEILLQMGLDRQITSPPVICPTGRSRPFNATPPLREYC